MASRENQTSLLTLVTVAIMLAVFAGLVWFVVEQQRAIPTRDDQQREDRLKNLAALNADNQKILTTYRWVDKGKGIIGIPIDRAMDLVVKDLSTNHPHPAGPITLPVAQPSATQQPSPNAANPPAPTPASSPAPAATPANSPVPTSSPVSSATPMSNAAPSSESASSPSATPAASPAANTLPAATPEVTPAPSPASDAPTPEASTVPSSAPPGPTGSPPSPQP